MKVIGITGGVGAGKSSVLELLEKNYRAFVLRTDEVGHKVLESGTEGYQQVVENFGVEILMESGEINRPRLAEIVFGDPEKLAKLNEIVHPLVKQYVKDELRRIRSLELYELFVIESALLFEDHYEILCDETWYIYVDSPTRIKRLMESRGYTEEKCQQIMNNQLSDEEFRSKCDLIIDNCESIENLNNTLKKVLEL